MVIAVVPALSPTLKTKLALVAVLPVVLLPWIVRVPLAAVEPLTKGAVILVVKVGLVPNTRAPVPVSSEIAPDIPAEVVRAVTALAPLPSKIPVKLEKTGAEEKVLAPAMVWVPVVMIPASVAEAAPMVIETSSGEGVVFSDQVTLATVPLAAVLMKLASVAALAFTVMESPALPDPQALPVPLITPEELACRHWVEPEIPEKVIAPEEVIPVAAVIAPEEFTWNRSPEPTVNIAAGEVSPIPNLPLEPKTILA